MRLLVLASALLITCSTAEEKKSLRLSVYYESHSPDSIHFIHELYKVWIEFKNYLELDLVPFGVVNATWNPASGSYEVICRNGPEECEDNKRHACAIFEACRSGSAIGCPKGKLKQVLYYIDCVVRHDKQISGIEQCASQVGLDALSILKCAGGTKGVGLLLESGGKTIVEGVTEVPYITINGVYSKPEQIIARLYLKALVCFYLKIPKLCDGYIRDLQNESSKT